MAAPKKKPSPKGTRKVAPSQVKPRRFEIVAHWGRELVKHEILTMTAKAIGWTLNNITYILSIIAGGYAFFAQQIAGIGTDRPLTLYIQAHPIRVSITAAIIAAATPLVRVIFRLLLKAIKHLPVFNSPKEDVEKGLSQAEQLLEAVGVSAFYPHSTKTEKNKNWRSCVDNIASHHARDLRIMGATGWNTFGNPKSPLYKLLSKFDGEVKVLLMLPDPKLPTLIRRAKEVKLTPEEYVAEINRSIELIKALRTSGKKISLKFYTQTPIWKMLISNDFMWVQHYCKAKDVEETPVYVFYSDGDGGTSLFHPLYSVWLKRWEHDDNKQCQFIEPCTKACQTCGLPSIIPTPA